MNFNLHFSVVCLVSIAAIFEPSITLAQQKQPQRENVRCEGKIKAMARGLIHVVGEDGQQWLISVDAKPQDISYQATSTPAFLRSGMLVQFRATLDKRGESQSPITEIRVIAPRDGIQLGLQQAGGFGGGELFASEDDPANKKKKKSADDKQYQVSGTLRGIKDRKIQVAAGGVLVKGELAENCGVSLDISDYTFAREGDPISLQGWHVVGKPDQIHATNMVITAEKPLLPSDYLGKRRIDKKEAEKETPALDAKKEPETGEPASEPKKKPAAAKKKVADPK
jgi:hypothetical protein